MDLLCMKKIVPLLIVLTSLLLAIFIYKSKCCKKKFLNIVLVGIAGSGKGTQGDLIKDKFNFEKISAGDALREHRESNGKYAEIINQKIDKGELVPSEITSSIMFEKVEKVISEGKKNGVLYDGFPRNQENKDSLNLFLKSQNKTVDAVVYIKVSEADVLDRLQNRMTCKKCGAIYNKKSKPTKVLGVCDECGGVHFSERADDADVTAIKSRFDIFDKMTFPLLAQYEKETKVLTVDGTGSPAEVFEKISTALSDLQK